MTNILLVTSSARGNASLSNQVADNLLENFRQTHPDAHVVRRDLAHDPLPHVDADFVGGLGVKEQDRNEKQRAAFARSDRLVDELIAADIVIVASPMYNFGIPSTLKAWIDHVARAGRTFNYSASGPVGLLNNKRAILIESRGGVYSQGPAKAMEHQESYLRSLLGFLGITNVQTILVEGTSIDAATAANAIQAGLAAARETATALRTAA